MPLSLTRILAQRPRDGSRGLEWNGRGGLPSQTLSMGSTVGEWLPTLVDLPQPMDEGLVIGLESALISRSDKLEPGVAAVWNVLACQEDSEYVPNVRIFLDPHPPCRLCEACASGNHWKCIEVQSRRWHPGWIAREMVVPPWTVRRGVCDLPARATVRSCLYLDPISRIRNGLTNVLKSKPKRVAVCGADLLGILTGFVLERMLPDSIRCLIDPIEARLGLAREAGFHQVASHAEGARLAMEDAPNLVVVTDGEASFSKALDLCAVGGTILLLVRPEGDLQPVGLDKIWQKSLRVMAAVGCSPSDREVAAHWIEDLDVRLGMIPVMELPFEQAALAQGRLDADPTRLAVVLTSG